MKTADEIYSFQERVIKEVVKKDDEHTKQTIKDYFIKKYPKENLRFDFLDEEIVNEVIQLGIAEYQRRQALGGILNEKENRDIQDYYIQKEAINIMQELSWIEGKLQDLLEEKGK